LVKSGRSHGFNFETPEIFNREVLAFLDSVKTDLEGVLGSGAGPSAP
jgi:hypothetical protein